MGRIAWPGFPGQALDSGLSPPYPLFHLFLILVTAQHPAFIGLLRASRIKHVVICGLAANICCFYVAGDLRRAEFDVYLVEDASAGIDVPAAGLYQAKAKAAAQRMGIHYVTTANVLEAVA